MLYNRLTAPAGEFPETESDEIWRPGRLWSLWDIMEELDINDYSDVVAEAYGYRITSIIEPDKPVPEDIKKEAEKGIVRRAALLAHRLDLDETISLVDRVQIQLMDQKLSFGDFSNALRHLGELLQSELEKRKCLALDQRESAFFEGKEHFGSAVTEAFPSATMDIEEAGNCIACGRYNAAVYHLVCAAEVGLRALAWDRRDLLP